MKVIKIKKHYHNGTRELFLILDLEDYHPDNVDYYVDDRCNQDPSGHNYGWESEWEFVTDEDIIKEQIIIELKTITKRMDKLSKEKGKLMKFLSDN